LESTIKIIPSRNNSASRAKNLPSDFRRKDSDIKVIVIKTLVNDSIV
jgi:hypothetical protein